MATNRSCPRLTLLFLALILRRILNLQDALRSSLCPAAELRARVSVDTCLTLCHLDAERLIVEVLVRLWLVRLETAVAQTRWQQRLRWERRRGIRLKARL